MRLPGCSRAKWLPECQYTAATATAADVQPSQLKPAIRVEPTTIEF